MPNEGFIIIKKNSGAHTTSKFFRPVDKGSAKPVFCYPRRVQALKEEHATMKKNIGMGLVSPERKMVYEQKMNQLGDRIKDIDASFDNAKKVINSDKDGWKARRDELGNAISEQMPTRDDVAKKRVNPHAVLRREKQGEKGNSPLEEIKRDYTIISRAFQAAGEYEEANHSFLQKDR